MCNCKGARRYFSEN